MGRVRLNPITKDIRGSLGHVVFRRTHAGEITLIKLADMSNIPWNQAQPVDRQRFKAADAKAALAELKACVQSEKATVKAGKRPFVWRFLIISRERIY